MQGATAVSASPRFVSASVSLLLQVCVLDKELRKDDAWIYCETDKQGKAKEDGMRRSFNDINGKEITFNDAEPSPSAVCAYAHARRAVFEAERRNWIKKARTWAGPSVCFIWGGGGVSASRARRQCTLLQPVYTSQGQDVVCVVLDEVASPYCRGGKRGKLKLA